MQENLLQDDELHILLGAFPLLLDDTAPLTIRSIH
jgi:hypothetical protein